jgi:hypothetical protein
MRLFEVLVLVPSDADEDALVVMNEARQHAIRVALTFVLSIHSDLGNVRVVPALLDPEPNIG